MLMIAQMTHVGTDKRTSLEYALKHSQASHTKY